MSAQVKRASRDAKARKRERQRRVRLARKRERRLVAKGIEIVRYGRGSS